MKPAALTMLSLLLSFTVVSVVQSAAKVSSECYCFSVRYIALYSALGKLRI